MLWLIFNIIDILQIQLTKVVDSKANDNTSGKPHEEEYHHNLKQW